MICLLLTSSRIISESIIEETTMQLGLLSFSELSKIPPKLWLSSAKNVEKNVNISVIHWGESICGNVERASAFPSELLWKKHYLKKHEESIEK